MLPLPQEALSREQKRAAANAARERYRFRLERIERDKREKAERLAQKTAAKPVATPVTDAQALIQAALERARAQAAAAKPKNTEQLTPEQQAQIDEIEARRAKAHEPAQPDVAPPKE